MNKILARIAVDRLEQYDHCFLKPETVREITEPFGFEGELYKAKDCRSELKGLTLNGINPKTGKEFQEGEYAEGQDAHKVAIQICNHLKLNYPDFFGIGSQLRGCCEVIRKYLDK